MRAELENAISDVGHWRWWLAELPKLFQLEFGWAQLWCEPLNPDDAPSSIVALRFDHPRAAAFFVRPDAELPVDWPLALQQDRIEPFHIEHGAFTMTSADAFNEIVRSMRVHEFVVGDAARLTPDAPFFLAFRADNVGVAVAAEGLRVVNHRGQLTADGVVEANECWWTYWREYWDRRDGDAPLPYDPACEVTIPAGPD